MYNLLVEGIRDLSRYTSLLQQRKVSHDPLSGIVDGSNKTFYTQYAPVLTSGSLLSYASGSAFVFASVDYDTGCVEFVDAPAKQPDATYTYTPFTQSQQVAMLMAGFDEMMSRWVRPGWYLSSGSASLVLPTGDEAGIYVVFKDASGSVFEPFCSGSLVFSQLRTQINLYMACCEYNYVARQQVEAALTGVSFRERFGTSLDRTQIPKHLSLATDRLETKVVRALRAAWDESYANGEQYGAGLAPAHSVGYEVEFDWHNNQEFPTVSDGNLRWL